MDQSRSRLRTIEALLKDNILLLQAQEKTQAAEQTLQASRKALHQAEEAVRAQRFKIEQTESTLYSGRVHNPKELQDMQSESLALKRHLSTLEDRQLEVMLAVEEAEASLKDTLTALHTVQAQTTEQQASLKGEQSALLRTVEKLEIEHQAAVNAIATADLTTYEMLRQQRRGIAVSIITNKSCSACGAVLNASVMQSAASPSQLVRCPTCGRILYAG